MKQVNFMSTGGGAASTQLFPPVGRVEFGVWKSGWSRGWLSEPSLVSPCLGTVPEAQVRVLGTESGQEWPMLETQVSGKQIQSAYFINIP